MSNQRNEARKLLGELNKDASNYKALYDLSIQLVINNSPDPNSSLTLQEADLLQEEGALKLLNAQEKFGADLSKRTPEELVEQVMGAIVDITEQQQQRKRMR